MSIHLTTETANAPALAVENIADSIVNLVKTRKRVCKGCKFIILISCSSLTGFGKRSFQAAHTSAYFSLIEGCVPEVSHAPEMEREAPFFDEVRQCACGMVASCRSIITRPVIKAST